MKIDLVQSETQRGFTTVEFRDERGNRCSLQRSSQACDEGLVWFGCDELHLQRFEAGIGWSTVELKHNHFDGPYYHANTRMHLSQTMIKQLLPYLQKFAETGELT